MTTYLIISLILMVTVSSLIESLLHGIKALNKWYWNLPLKQYNTVKTLLLIPIWIIIITAGIIANTIVIDMVFDTTYSLPVFEFFFGTVMMSGKTDSGKSRQVTRKENRDHVKKLNSEKKKVKKIKSGNTESGIIDRTESVKQQIKEDKIKSYNTGKVTIPESVIKYYGDELKADTLHLIAITGKVTHDTGTLPVIHDDVKVSCNTSEDLTGYWRVYVNGKFHSLFKNMDNKGNYSYSYGDDEFTISFNSGVVSQIKYWIQQYIKYGIIPIDTDNDYSADTETADMLNDDELKKRLQLYCPDSTLVKELIGIPGVKISVDQIKELISTDSSKRDSGYLYWCRHHVVISESSMSHELVIKTCIPGGDIIPLPKLFWKYNEVHNRGTDSYDNYTLYQKRIDTSKSVYSVDVDYVEKIGEFSDYNDLKLYVSFMVYLHVVNHLDIQLKKEITIPVLKDSGNNDDDPSNSGKSVDKSVLIEKFKSPGFTEKSVTGIIEESVKETVIKCADGIPADSVKELPVKQLRDDDCELLDTLLPEYPITLDSGFQYKIQDSGFLNWCLIYGVVIWSRDNSGNVNLCDKSIKNSAGKKTRYKVKRVYNKNMCGDEWRLYHGRKYVDKFYSPRYMLKCIGYLIYLEMMTGKLKDYNRDEITEKINTALTWFTNNHLTAEEYTRAGYLQLNLNTMINYSGNHKVTETEYFMSRIESINKWYIWRLDTNNEMVLTDSADSIESVKELVLRKYIFLTELQSGNVTRDKLKLKSDYESSDIVTLDNGTEMSYQEWSHKIKNCKSSIDREKLLTTEDKINKIGEPHVILCADGIPADSVLELPVTDNQLVTEFNTSELPHKVFDITNNQLVTEIPGIIPETKYDAGFSEFKKQFQIIFNGVPESSGITELNRIIISDTHNFKLYTTHLYCDYYSRDDRYSLYETRDKLPKIYTSGIDTNSKFIGSFKTREEMILFIRYNVYLDNGIKQRLDTHLFDTELKLPVNIVMCDLPVSICGNLTHLKLPVTISGKQYDNMLPVFSEWRKDKSIDIKGIIDRNKYQIWFKNGNSDWINTYLLCETGIKEFNKLNKNNETVTDSKFIGNYKLYQITSNGMNQGEILPVMYFNQGDTDTRANTILALKDYVLRLVYKYGKHYNYGTRIPSHLISEELIKKLSTGNQ